MGRVFLFIKNFWCFLWHWLIVVIPVRFFFPSEPSWLGADWYALLAGYEWGVPLTVFAFISFVMASQYIEFNRFPLVSLFSGRGLIDNLNTGVEDYLKEVGEEAGKTKENREEQDTKAKGLGIINEVNEDSDEDSQKGGFKVLPPSL